MENEFAESGIKIQHLKRIDFTLPKTVDENIIPRDIY